MKTSLLILGIVVSLMLIAGTASAAGCTTSPPQPALTPTPPPPPTPTPIPPPTLAPASAVVLGTAERHNTGDLEGMMAYWADDAIFYMFGMPPTGSEVALGKEQIQAIFDENIANHAQWEVEIVSVIGDVVNTRSRNWHDFTRQIGVAPLEATGVYVIKDGVISTYYWTLSEDSAVRLKTALAEAIPDEPAEEPADETPVSELTVTIADGMCSYNSSLALQPGEIQVTIDVKDQDKDLYAVAFFTLEQDKDFIDLMAATVRSHPPAWSNMFSIKEVWPGKSETYSITVAEGPVYAVCFSQPPDQAIGAVGPFSVSPVPATATPTNPPPEIPESDIVVTFAKGTCTVDGPEIYPTGELTVTINTLNVKDMDREGYGLTFFNLEPGKDLHDLVASQDSPSPPPWADMFSMHDAPPATIRTYVITVEAGPVYLLCWEDRVVGEMGPIEVSP